MERSQVPDSGLALNCYLFKLRGYPEQIVQPEIFNLSLFISKMGIMTPTLPDVLEIPGMYQRSDYCYFGT